MGILHLGVLLAAVWVVSGLVFLRRKVKAYGQRKLFSKPAGDPRQGIRYAFIQGMAPWAKESVMMNLPSYGAGMAFHAGVFTGFALLLAALVGLVLPGPVLAAARVLTLLGAAGGFSLFVKRLTHPNLRGFSSPDDYVSNLLSGLFALLAFAWTFSASLEAVWMTEAVLLLVYAPLGKIRHCLFFFSTRSQLGAFFGRRGTYPPGGSTHA